jgi:hypothetical protein
MYDIRIESLRQSLKSQAEEFARKFYQRLCANSSAKDFLHWLLRYDAFNRGFPGAAAELAGRIACMIDLFGDIEAEMIASRVIAAITDEFLDRQTGTIALHSKLRRELVLFCLGNLSSQPRHEALAVVETYTPFRKEILAMTRRGYGLEIQEERLTFYATFTGLGFFAASETSGSSEFVTLNRYMDEKWPQLKTAMQSKDDDRGRALYSWIADHEDLEADHAGFAFNAIELALQELRLHTNLSSNDRRVIALEAVKEGVRNFFEMANRTLLS